MVPFPQNFVMERYSRWHEYKFPKDKPLLESIKRIREEVKEKSDAHLTMLGQLISKVAAHTEKECKIQTKGLAHGTFDLPIRNFRKESKYFELLFKSIESIANKMWRQNREVINDGDLVHLGNLNSVITDLVRTSVVAPTLFHAKLLVERLKAWKDVIDDEERVYLLKSIEYISVDEKAKLSSGYFAYHCLIKFHDYVPIELQVFSQLVSSWRKISHKIYEMKRSQKSGEETMNSPITKLVSLGHLLFLAECELETIQSEIKDSIDSV